MILLFRMGDFYETFEEDAKVTSRVLGITLTKRGNGAAGEVPLAGFPYHALESYLPRLLKAGLRVAVCEQLEDPKFAKGIVKRDVVEVVSPGVAFSEKVLDHKKNNYLVSVALESPIAPSDQNIGFSFIDVTTGDFSTSEFPLRQLPEYLGNLNAPELLVQKRDYESIKSILRNSFTGIYTKIDDWIFNFDYGYDILLNHFKTKSLKGFGVEPYKVGIIAAGAVIHYLKETQKSNIPHIRKIIPFDASNHMVLDPSTKRNLEILSTTAGDAEGSLFSILDRTLTPMGGRLLKQWVNHPLRQLEEINQRLGATKEFFEESEKRLNVREILGRFGDLERLNGRIATGRGNPRDVRAVKESLDNISPLQEALESSRAQILIEQSKYLDPITDLSEYIEKAIEPDPPVNLNDGGVIRKGFDSELDELRSLAFSGKDWIAQLQHSERERTGIPSLKVGFNNVFGYYIEVTNTHKDKIPENYNRKQTLTNAERYITPELKEYEQKILSAEERILILETKLFQGVRDAVAAKSDVIQTNAKVIALVDCHSSLAEVAYVLKYVCPVVDDSLSIEIKLGRHPVIEVLLPPGEQYTPNDSFLNNFSDQILILTGPNMSGKSSYLRQVGLIVLLSQIGSFVPAESARIGIVDKIFTRVGASDNITSGESTFLVEMHEAANIVNTATNRSLILLDEVGRGTSTFDGISIAWALTEYLHERIGAKTIFATHYHELNELAEQYPRIKNYKVDVKEYGDKVIFLHTVTPGFADHSYGIQVAQMAGLPEEVTDRAKQILKNLEGSELVLHRESEDANSKLKGRIRNTELQLKLFEIKDDEIRKELISLDLDAMPPIEALKKLHELKKKANS